MLPLGTRAPNFLLTDLDGNTVSLEDFKDAKAYLEKITRFNMTHFRPEPEYLREMKRFGVLGPEYQPGDLINVYDTDREYWQSMWHTPAPSRRVGRTPESSHGEP